jgi:hypothetical protein
MSNADRIGDMPTREADIAGIEPKVIVGDEENMAEDDSSEGTSDDHFITLRKSSAFTLL